MNIVIPDYLWLTQWNNIDNKALYNTCINVETELAKIFPSIPDEKGYGCFTSIYHDHYNLFSFPCAQLSELYMNMAKSFGEILRPGKYYIRSWVNLFDKGKNIDWHSHWNAKYKTYHGFYCVNTEGEHESYTEYAVPALIGEQICRIKSTDGLCVIGKSETDQHRSSEWLNDNGYRVTIAFDIIPLEALRPEERFTHIDINREFLHNFIPLLIIK
jgi:hypothetical protein